MLFTGYGLSLLRFRGGELHADFALDSRKVPEHESKVRERFAAKGILPSEDYLANMGRTRSLSFPIASHPDEVVALCKEVILEVFGLEDDDAIDYAFGTSGGPE